MRRAERIIFAFGAFGETGKAAARAQRADPVTPASDDLVRIALMANVPDELIVGGVKDIMDRGGQLDNAEPGSQVSAGYRDRRNHLCAQLIGELAKLF